MACYLPSSALSVTLDNEIVSRFALPLGFRQQLLYFAFIKPTNQSMSPKDCSTHKLKYEASFSVCKLALFSTTFMSQTKEIIKEQSHISSLAYSTMIDSNDFGEGGKRVSITFTNLFLNSSSKNTGKRALFH